MSAREQHSSRPTQRTRHQASPLIFDQEPHMNKFIAALVALTVVTAAAAPSYAFDVKTFWETHRTHNG